MVEAAKLTKSLKRQGGRGPEKIVRLFLNNYSSV